MEVGPAGLTSRWTGGDHQHAQAANMAVALVCVPGAVPVVWGVALLDAPGRGPQQGVAKRAMKAGDWA